MSQDKLATRQIGGASAAGYAQGKTAKKSTKDQVTWLDLRPCLVPSWCEASRTEIAGNRVAFRDPSSAVPRDPPQRKMGIKIKEHSSSGFVKNGYIL